MIFNIKINRRYNSILTNKYLNLLYITLYKFIYLLKDMQFQIFIIIFFRFKIRFKIVIFPSYLSSTIREHTQNLEKNNILHFTTVSSSNYPFKPTTTDFQVYLHIYLPPTDFATSRFKPGLSLSLSLSYSFANTYIAGFFLGLVLSYIPFVPLPATSRNGLPLG